MLVPDTRGERTRHLIMGSEHYDQIFERWWNATAPKFCFLKEPSLKIQIHQDQENLEDITYGDRTAIVNLSQTCITCPLGAANIKILIIVGVMWFCLKQSLSASALKLSLYLKHHMNVKTRVGLPRFSGNLTYGIVQLYDCCHRRLQEYISKLNEGLLFYQVCSATSHCQSSGGGIHGPPGVSQTTPLTKSPDSSGGNAILEGGHD